MFKGRSWMELSRLQALVLELWRTSGQVLIFPRNCALTARASTKGTARVTSAPRLCARPGHDVRQQISSERSVSSVGRSSDHPAQCGAHPVKLDQDFLWLTPCSATDPWVVLDFVALNYPNHFWPHVTAFTNTISPRSWTQRQSGQSKVHPSWRSSRAKFRLIRF